MSDLLTRLKWRVLQHSAEAGVGLLTRLKWVVLRHQANGYKDKNASELIEAIIQEIESTHRIVDPEVITEDMLNACFSALPEHYDPPDPKRRAWHAYKAKRRYTAMVKATKKLLCTN